jgi:hypothetical protein
LNGADFAQSFVQDILKALVLTADGVILALFTAPVAVLGFSGPN